MQIFLKKSSRVKFHVLAGGQKIMSLQKHALLHSYAGRKIEPFPVKQKKRFDPRFKLE